MSSLTLRLLANLDGKGGLFWFLPGVGTKKTPQLLKASVFKQSRTGTLLFPFLWSHVLTMHDGASMFTWGLQKLVAFSCDFHETNENDTVHLIPTPHPQALLCTSLTLIAVLKVLSHLQPQKAHGHFLTCAWFRKLLGKKKKKNISALGCLLRRLASAKYWNEKQSHQYQQD